MARVVHGQAELFAPAQRDMFAGEAVAPVAEEEPISALNAMLAALRAADRLPWATTSEAVQAEYHAQALGRAAGDEGARLVSAIFEETERLFSAEEQ